MATFANAVRTGRWTGVTGSRIRSVVNIGIGGSDLGPVMAAEALKSYSLRELNCDSFRTSDATQNVEACATSIRLRRYSSFHPRLLRRRRRSQRETAKTWLLKALGDETAVARHFAAVSTNDKAVKSFGIDTANMFEFWDWVGGRYSLCSAIGLSVMISIGPGRFQRHAGRLSRDGPAFTAAPFERNLPVILA